MNLIPIGDRIFVRRDTPEALSTLIDIPENFQDKSDRGVVIAVGPGKLDMKTGEIKPATVKVGDTVLYAKYVGEIVKVDGEELLMMRENQIFAIVRD